jgi:uncharacterized protein YjiS (DUF1127 family)
MRNTILAPSYDRSLAETGILGSLRLRRLWRVLARQRSRACLRALDDHMLNDIGLTRDQATVESAKPFWTA